MPSTTITSPPDHFDYDDHISSFFQTAARYFEMETQMAPTHNLHDMIQSVFASI